MHLGPWGPPWACHAVPVFGAARCLQVSMYRAAPLCVDACVCVCLGEGGTGCQRVAAGFFVPTCASESV